MSCCDTGTCSTTTTTTVADPAGRTFTVSGMTCGACAAKVTAAVRAVPGVSDAVVDLARATLTVTGPASAAAITAAVTAAGYTTHP